MRTAERTSSDWFHEASRCYLEGHQACAWCGAAHQVYRNTSFGRVDYQCNNCDFQASHDMKTDRYVVVPGENCASAGTATMHDIKTI